MSISYNIWFLTKYKVAAWCYSIANWNVSSRVPCIRVRWSVCRQCPASLISAAAVSKIAGHRTWDHNHDVSESLSTLEVSNTHLLSISLKCCVPTTLSCLYLVDHQQCNTWKGRKSNVSCDYWEIGQGVLPWSNNTLSNHGKFSNFASVSTSHLSTFVLQWALPVKLDDPADIHVSDRQLETGSVLLSCLRPLLQGCCTQKTASSVTLQIHSLSQGLITVTRGAA